MGGRKLFHELQSPLAALGISRGRDAFFDLLRDHDLLVPTKRSRQRTTRSGLWRCPNLLTDLTVTGPNQVWVAETWQKAQPVLDKVVDLLNWKNDSPEAIAEKLTAVRDVLLEAYERMQENEPTDTTTPA